MPPQYAPAPCKLTFDLLALKVVFESRVTWATSVPILVFLGLSVLNLGPMYATGRPTDVRRASLLNAPAVGAGHNKAYTLCHFICAKSSLNRLTQSNKFGTVTNTGMEMFQDPQLGQRRRSSSVQLYFVFSRTQVTMLSCLLLRGFVVCGLTR